MRILITSIVDLEKSMHNRLHEFVKHLSSNHEITLLSINDHWKAKQVDISLYSEDFKDTLHKTKIKHFTERRVSPVLQEIFSVVTMGKILDEVDHGSFDVHLNYNALISGYYVARKAKAKAVNTVYDFADDIPAMVRASSQIPPAFRCLGGTVANIMVKRNISIAQKVTTITSSLKDSYHVPQNKVEYIPNGVDTELFKYHPDDEMRKELGIKQDFVLGYTGALREWVDFEPVFAAVKKLEQNYSNIKILIVGEEGGLEKTKKLAMQYRISDRTIFTGTVPYTQVPQYISAMDVCLTARKINTVSEKMLPTKLFGYMACEKPVISPRLSGTVEALGDRILYASNAEEYQAQITRLYYDKELGTGMGEEGRRFVQDNYTWSAICSKLGRVLEEASEHKSTASRQQSA